MIDLGTLGGSFSRAYAVNASGQVVGFGSIAEDAEFHAFSWTATGGMTDLGTLGGTFSYIADLNDSGQSVGISSVAGDAAYHATLWQSITPAQAIANLANVILSFGLDHGAQTSLVGKLNDALSAIASQDTPRACVDLAALINEASAQSEKHLTTTQAHAIRDAAMQIQSQLGC
jgi:probable HAF family extracellular repeat protein